MLRALVVVAVLVATSALPNNGAQTRVLPRKTAQLVESAGYPLESYEVTTSDGYILTVHRIPYGKNGPTEGRKPVVFLMHGLEGTSSHFVTLGENSIAFNLADAGFDVWLGNARGNSYSRKHVTLDPDRRSRRFFDFSWEEIGVIDVPAMVDLVLAQTGEEKLHYIGHSQGGTVFYVLTSMNPSYGEKFASAYLLAGVGYMSQFPSRIIRTVARFSDTIYTAARFLGIVDLSLDGLLPFSLSRGAKTSDLSDYCFEDDQDKDLCDVVDVLVEELGLLSLEMGGASIKQIAHFGQNINDRAFRRWDYGRIRNLINYGSFRPPSYDLSRITVNTTIFYSLADIFISEKDALDMAAAIPNAIAKKVPRDTFKHTGYALASDTKELVTDYIIEQINEYEKL